MPIPEMIDGFLPPGVHDCSIEELREVFGRFVTSDHRVTLFNALAEYWQDARASRLVASLVVDGSFVTAKERPSDVDLLLGLTPGGDLSELLPADYNVVSKRRVRSRYPFDVLVAPADGEAYLQHLAFFANVKGDETRTKGLLRLTS